MNRFILIFIVGFVWLSGCSQESNLTLIIANKEIKVFPDTAEKQKPLFKIAPEEICAAGDKIEQKVFTIRKVLCGNGKKGYIIARADDSYKIIKE